VKRVHKPHRKRFANWCRLGGKPLVTLASLVEARLVQPLIETGFGWVDACFWQPDDPVSGSDITLERRTGSEIEEITFNFDKYHRPTFQLHLHRRVFPPPHQWVRSANLVRNNRQYYHFWGKPWWMPTRFWSEHMSERTVDKLAGHFDQMLAFLEHGERGANISRPTGLQPPPYAQIGSES
jgi:hypothetical protein